MILKMKLRRAVRQILSEKDQKTLHVFDFDDTLAQTKSATYVAGVDYNGGDPDDEFSYEPVSDLRARVSKAVKNVNRVESGPGISAGKIRSDTFLNNAEPISLDTDQYRDWKNDYVSAGGKKRLVINPNIDSQIKKVGSQMSASGKTGEINVADYSPSSRIGSDATPIKHMLKYLAAAEKRGDNVAVVTARKGKTDFDSLSGNKVPAKNASDIKQFIRKQVGIAPNKIIGAADIDPVNPGTAKKDIITKMAADPNVDRIKFYDDDSENTNNAMHMCNGGGEELSGKQLDVYNLNFVSGEYPRKPTSSCKIKESRLRAKIKKIIREVVEKNA
jgi:hypothetical protein